MDGRIIAGSRVTYRGRNQLATTVPRAVLSIIGLPSRISWHSGPGYLYVRPPGDGHDSYKVGSGNLVMIPKRARDAIGADGGAELEWVLAPVTGKGHEVRVQNTASRGARAASAARVRHKGCAPGPARIGTTKGSRVGPSTGFYMQSVVPKECVRIIGAEDASHVRWAAGRNGYALEPCGENDRGAVRLSRVKSQRGGFSYVVRLAGPFAGSVRDGNGRVAWYGSSDGDGGWKVWAAPDKG